MRADVSHPPRPGRLCITLSYLTAAMLVACIDDGQVDKIPDAGAKAGELIVTFIDVGQGDSILLELPTGHVLLIDGGDDGLGTEEILPLLDEKGVNVVDLLVLSHPHMDHYGGLDEVLFAKEVLEIWENGEIGTTDAYTAYSAARDEEGAPVVIPIQGYSRNYGEVRIEVLNAAEGYPGENNDSLVLLVELGQVAILLPGDVEAEEQDDLVSDFNGDLAVDVIKVPHHGSANFDPQFVVSTSPKYAVISSGMGNEYGHPHQESIDAYLSVEAIVCRTDQSGDITVRTTGHKLDFGCAHPLP